MSKHTPVTWFIDIEGNRILANDDRATIICHMSATVRNPEVMADANLIAAAPELLEALEPFAHIEIDSALEIVPNGYPDPQEWRNHVLAARSAIAKAKGESV